MQNDNKLAAFMAAMVSAAEAEAAEMRETAADEEAAALAECRAGTETDSKKLIAAAEGHVGVFYESDAGETSGLHITARVNTGRGIRCRAVADDLPDYAEAEEPSLEDAYLYLISREAAQ